MLTIDPRQWYPRIASRALLTGSALMLVVGIASGLQQSIWGAGFMALGAPWVMAVVASGTLLLYWSGRESLAGQVLVWGSWCVVVGFGLAPDLQPTGSYLLGLPVLIVLAALVLTERATIVVALLSGAAVLLAGAALMVEHTKAALSEVPHLLFLEGMILLITVLTLQMRRAFHNMGHLAHATNERVVQSERGAVLDATTGLPNRKRLMSAIEQALDGSTAAQQFALLLVNLDRFHTVNLALGHDVGDRILANYGALIASAMPADALTARLTGDEFAVLLRGQDEVFAPHALDLLAHELQRSFSRFVTDAAIGAVHLTTSIGITTFPRPGGDSRIDVLRRADNALQRAKLGGGNRAEHFEDSMGEQAIERFALETALKRAVPDNQLVLFAQSQFNRTGQIVGAELLLRWNHPSRGLIAPGQFLPLAEESDLVVALGSWVLDHACDLLAQLQQIGAPLSLAVNISPRQFLKPDFEERLWAATARAQAHPTRLMLEITENLIMHDSAAVIAKMERLADSGFRFSIDDFGTGYSSLAYLKRLPVHEIKIAQVFVQDAPNHANDAALVRAIISLAEHLQMRVVAEGVETPEHAKFLREFGDITYQGYLFARPVPAQQWIEAIRASALERAISGVRVRYEVH